MPDKKYLLDVLRGEIMRMPEAMTEAVHSCHGKIDLKSDDCFIFVYYCYPR